MPYDLSGIRPWCVGLTWAYLGLTLIHLPYLAYALRLGADPLDDLPAPGPDELLGPAALAVLIVSVLALGVLIAAFVVNAIWIYWASANSRAIDPWEGRIRPGWAVGWFFIPIANLWMPYRGIKQIWHSTFSPGGDPQAPAPRFFAPWWGAWVIGDILSNASLRISFREGTEAFLTSTWLDLIAAPFTLVSGFLFLRILREVTDGQLAQPASAEVFA